METIILKNLQNHVKRFSLTKKDTVLIGNVGNLLSILRILSKDLGVDPAKNICKLQTAEELKL